MALMMSAALVAITAILVVFLPVFLPKFFRTPLPVITEGYVAPGFEGVLDTFRENFETGRDPRSGGSAFSVYYRGEKVVDIWGGYADVESKQKWREDTLSILFSSTKGVAATCIAMLVDRGLVDYNKPVAHYWPEFAQNGKGKITVRQLIEHKAGLVLAPPPGLSYEVLKDVAKAGELMAAAESLWEVDGHTHGYHSFTMGPLANELLRRVDPKHRTMGQFVREEIAEPFDIDLHIGLPLELNYRVARLETDKRPMLQQLIEGLMTPQSRQLMSHVMKTGHLNKIVENVNELGNLGIFNDPAYRALEIPSANGYGTARGLAKLYGILAAGGTDPAARRTLLSKERVATFLDSDPLSIDMVLGLPMSFSHGMTMLEFQEGVKMFGHPGSGGQLGCADPTNQVGFAFISRHMLPVMLVDDPRSNKLIETVYKCIKTLQKSE